MPLFMTEATNQQGMYWANAVGGFFRGPLHLPFASGMRRNGTKISLVLPALT